MSTINIQQHVRAVYEQGFTMIEAFYTPEECRKMCDLLDEHWRRSGSPALSQSSFGFTIHPLMPSVPDLAPMVDRPEFRDLMGEILQDEPRCTHLGARMSDGQCDERIAWHHHYGWDTAPIAGRKRVERLLWGPYINGTMPEVGPVIMYPRRFDDPFEAARGPSQTAWPGEMKINAPPGSVAVFDTAVWHSAQKGTQPGRRRLWGGHFQGWNDPRPHGEDNAVDVPEVAKYKAECPIFRAMVSRAI